MKTETNTDRVTITALSRPLDGMTHRVRTPLMPSGILVASLDDARRVAAGFTPADGRPVEVIETPAKVAP
jgi:hypothetical protein